MSNNDIRKIYSRVPVRPLSKSAYENIISILQGSNIDLLDKNNKIAFKNELVVDYRSGDEAIYVLNANGDLIDISKLHLQKLIYGKELQEGQSYPDPIELEDIKIDISNIITDASVIGNIDVDGDNKISIKELISFYISEHEEHKVEIQNKVNSQDEDISDNASYIKEIMSKLNTIMGTDTNGTDTRGNNIPTSSIRDIVKNEIDSQMNNILDVDVAKIQDLADKYNEAFSSNASVIDTMKTNIAKNTSDIGSINSSINTINSNITGINTNINSIKTNITSLQNSKDVYVSHQAFSSSLKTAAEAVGATLFVQIDLTSTGY